MLTEGLENLRVAIIKQAIQDWTNNDDRNEIIRFFTSEWGIMLLPSGVSPQRVIQRLQEIS